MALQVVRHGAEIRGGITTIDGKTIRFSDGSTLEADIILLSTGWRPRFQFLEAAHPDVAAAAVENWNLYRRTFTPRFGDGLAFVGFARPAFGGMPPLAELQARWAALVISGDLALPPPERMEAQIVHDREATKRQFVPKGRVLTDFYMHARTIAGEIGCRPDLVSLFFSKPRLWYKVVACPIMGASWRLTGPGACPTYAEPVLRASPTSDFAWLWFLTHALYATLYLVGYGLLRISYFEHYLAAPLTDVYTSEAAMRECQVREKTLEAPPVAAAGRERSHQ
jgi:dimethylaniline monooxygenase (N-oxide forming)